MYDKTLNLLNNATPKRVAIHIKIKTINRKFFFKFDLIHVSRYFWIDNF